MLAKTLKAIASPGDLGHRDERMKTGKERVVNKKGIREVISKTVRF